MRIGFIYRGDPRHRTANRVSMLKNIAAAKRLGSDVTLIIPREGMSEAKALCAVEDALVDFGIQERFSVKRIPRPVVFGRGRRTFDFMAALWARTQSFDLIWSREFRAADYATVLGLNTIVEHHHPFTERQWAVARRMLGRASFKGVAAISGVHKRLLLDEGWPEERVIAAHSGVDPSQFSSEEKRASDLRRKLAKPGQPLIVYAGSLYAGKGSDQILLAAERMREARFVLIGGRSHEVEALRKRAAAARLTNVELAGHVPHSLVPDYLCAADVLVAPFTEEGRDIAGKVIIPFASPLKIFEYMAAGKPIVTSKIGAIPEVIRHLENGLLVQPGDVEELVGAISRLLDDRELSARLGTTAQRDVRRYTWEERAARILRFALGQGCAGTESNGVPHALLKDESLSL